MDSSLKKLVLASTSPYRAELLGRLCLKFEIAAPECDEKPLESETASDLVLRLSIAKARSLQVRYPNALIIGSDQVAERDGIILGKPGNYESAMDQLSAASGRSVVFHTGVCLYDVATSTYTVDCVATRVRFRKLSREQIDRYLTAEKPYQCAGGFKSEKRGISLFENIVGDDPTALVGLPLISLSGMLNDAGIRIP